MEYAIIVNEKSYDLPKKTLMVMEKLDEVLRVDTVRNLSVRQKYEKLHNFVKDMVGAENAAEMFGSNNISEIDTSEISLAVLKIRDAYDKPIADYTAERSMRKLDGLPIDKITQLVKGMDAVANSKVVGK